MFSDVLLNRVWLCVACGVFRFLAGMRYGSMILPVPVPSTNMHIPLYKSLVSGISARARYKKTKEESITRTRENKTTLGITNGTRHRPHNPHAACRMALARFPPWHVATYVGHVPSPLACSLGSSFGLIGIPSSSCLSPNRPPPVSFFPSFSSLFFPFSSFFLPPLPPFSVFPRKINPMIHSSKTLNRFLSFGRKIRSGL